jgi:hypothetical protein
MSSASGRWPVATWLRSAGIGADAYSPSVPKPLRIPAIRE